MIFSPHHVGGFKSLNLAATFVIVPALPLSRLLQARLQSPAPFSHWDRLLPPDPLALRICVPILANRFGAQ